MFKRLSALLLVVGLLGATPAMAGTKLKNDEEALRAAATLIAAELTKVKCSKGELKKNTCATTIKQLKPLINRIEFLILTGE